jgi:glycosyltransferase involved in cell wall biosynthesis
MHEPLRREFPRLKLLVVGAVTEPLRRFESVPGVQFVGFQSDIRTYFQQAHVNIVPLRAGSGTRFKILESWAMGRPVVSTTVGAEGLPFRDGDNILVADSSSDFCSRIGLLLRDPGIRRRLAEAGRRVVQEQFSWQTIVAHLDGQLTRLRDERSDGFRATGQNS